ncbi:SOS response-associated peptidase [Shinella sp. CPCC 101442]|nr:SOS response-associated peptidase [Shinella sp. CPCC 101442]
MPGVAPYAFSGLWAHNAKLDVTSCTIITAPSIAPISQIHDRMPIILDPEVFEGWLNPATPKENLKGILARHLDGEMQMHRVSRDINSSRLTERPAPIVSSL